MVPRYFLWGTDVKSVASQIHFLSFEDCGPWRMEGNHGFGRSVLSTD